MPDKSGADSEREQSQPPATRLHSEGEKRGGAGRQDQQADSATPRRRRPQVPPSWLEPQSVFSALIFLTTLAYTIFSYHLWQETKEAVDYTRRSVELAEESRKDAVDSLAETRRSNDLSAEALELSRDNYLLAAAEVGLSEAASKQALRLTRESNDLTREGLEFSQRALRVTERPWIVTTMKRQALSSEGPNNLIIALTNAGSSPAFELRGNTSGLLVDRMPDSLPILETPKEPTRGSVSVLGPGARNDIHSHLRTLSSEELAAVKNGERMALVFGTYAYEDSFGDTYGFSFCYKTVPADPDQWIYCERFNNHYEHP